MAEYKECLPCPSYCPYCSDPLTCLSCNYGYYLSGGNCKQCSTKNCYGCDNGVANQCTVCNEGYHLTSSKSCVTCPENCNICSDTHTCTSCSSGFYLNAEVCSACTMNCDKCTDADTCQSCNDGYFLQQSNGKCMTCPN